MKWLILLVIFKFIKTSLKFTIEYGKPKCFIEELFSTSVGIIKWKISDLPEDQKIRDSKVINSRYYTKHIYYDI
jgi:hypothetical protein